jgi:hypothetical protein
VNTSQRLLVIAALVVIGLALAFLILEWGDGRRFLGETRILVYERQNAEHPSLTDYVGLYTRYGGVAGVLLGVIAPLCLFATAAFIALGTKRQSGSERGQKRNQV